MSNQDSEFIKICQVFKEDGAVLFLGSGISRWSGLPSWYGMIEELAEFVKNEGFSYEHILSESSTNLLTAAGIGVQKLSPQQFKTFIRKSCRVGESEPHNLHEKIVNLGPRSYITTNYDKLLEESLRIYKKSSSFQVVTNRQPIDCASIVQIREKDFVFKPHGDIDDTESIILTHDQYRKLYGTQNHTLKALETILLTRPVVFLGFSLTDPDFITVKDKIENTFKGGGLQHYAIMPDVSDDKKKYYLDSFGIRIINYNTAELPNGLRDHSPLLELLDKLISINKNSLSKDIRSNNSIVKDELSDSQLLALLRYASGISFNLFINDEKEFPLYVKEINENIFSEIDIIDLLKEKKENRILLLGNPGVGKTYSFKKYCRDLALTLKEKLVTQDSENKELIIPILIDLKLYDGNIWRMIESTLPTNIELNDLLKSNVCVFILDSFNEMPKDIFEDGLYEEDFDNFFDRINDSKVVLGSRNKEGINFNNFSEYSIEGIPYKFVESHLNEQSILEDKNLQREIIILLQKPFFFKLFIDEMIPVSYLTSPNLIYLSFFLNINKKFKDEFKQDIYIPLLLKSVAYSSISNGKEALNVQEVLSKLSLTLKLQMNQSISAEKVLDWLLKEELLIPMPNQRVSFFHQSITEYLAAMELANLYKSSPEILEDCLRNTRWDQALFLTTGFLNPVDSPRFIFQVLEKDIVLAVNASKYIEYNQGEIVTFILDFLVDNIETFKNKLEYDLSYPLKNLSVDESHEPQLRRLLNEGNLFGQIAIKLLYKIKGNSIKKEILDIMWKNHNDFNFISQIGDTLEYDVEIDDLKSLILKLKDIRPQECEGLVNQLAKMIAKFDTVKIDSIFNEIDELTELELEIYSETLREIGNEYAIKKLINLINLNKVNAVFDLYLVIDKINFNIDILDENLIRSLLSIINNNSEKNNWGISLLEKICEIKSGLYFYLKYLSTSPTISRNERIVIFYLLRFEESEKFWIEFQEVISESRIKNNIITQFDRLNWSGQEHIINLIFEKRDIKLLESFLQSVRHNSLFSYQLTFDNIKTILEWLESHRKFDSLNDDYWVLQLMKEFIVEHTERSTQKEIIEFFNSENCIFRSFLEDVIFTLPLASTDSLSENAIQYCLNNLYNYNYRIFDKTIGSIATESFVQHKLLPLLSQSDKQLKLNLQEVLRQAGNLHKKRYIKTLI